MQFLFLSILQRKQHVSEHVYMLQPVGGLKGRINANFVQAYKLQIKYSNIIFSLLLTC